MTIIGLLSITTLSSLLQGPEENKKIESNYWIDINKI